MSGDHVVLRIRPQDTTQCTMQTGNCKPHFQLYRFLWFSFIIMDKQWHDKGHMIEMLELSAMIIIG